MVEKTCRNCRYGEYRGGPGGDCHSCENHNAWRELKRVDEEKCAICKYEKDPCHYLCVDCQDSKNWEAKPNLRQILNMEIEKHRSTIKALEQRKRWIFKPGLK